MANSKTGGEMGRHSQSETGNGSGKIEITDAKSPEKASSNPFKITDQTTGQTQQSIEGKANPFMNAVNQSPEATENNRNPTEENDESENEEEDSKVTSTENKTENKKFSRVENKVENNEGKEGGEITQDQALKEIDLRTLTDEELEATEESAEKDFIIDGHGETISRADAARRMMDDLSASLDQLQKDGRELSEEQKQAILDDAKRSLYSQEAESQSRAIGNHGIPHLYSVYERMHDAASDEVLKQAVENLHEKNPDSKATVDDLRTAMVLAAVYHDEGYLSATAREGAGHDALHGVDSAIAFQYNHAENLNGVIDPTVLEQVQQAIAEHNGLPSTAEAAFRKVGETAADNPARAKILDGMDLERNSDMDPNENFIRSALLLSDRLALDTAEKMPDALRDQERAQVMIAYYQKRAEGTVGEGDEAALRKTLSDMVRADTSLDDDQRQHYLDAIEKDVNTNAGKFDLPMAGVAIPAGSLQYRVVSDRNGGKHIEAVADIKQRLGERNYTLSFDEHSEEVTQMKKGAEGSEDESGTEGEKNPSIEAAQLTKSLKDFGITDASMEEVHGKNARGGWLEKTDANTFVVQTSVVDDETGELREIDGLKNVTIRISEMTAEDEKRLEGYMENALKTASEKAEKAISEADEALEATEKEKEAVRAEDVHRETYDRKMKEFREISQPTKQDMVTLCTEIYSPENKAEIDEISKVLSRSDIDAETLAQMAQRCKELSA